MADHTLGEWKLCRRCTRLALQEHRYCTRCGGQAWAPAPPNLALLSGAQAEGITHFSPVPWSASDVVKGTVFFILSALSATVLFTLVLLWVGGGEVGPFALAATVVVEGILVVAVWLFAVSKYQISWGALGFWRGPGVRDVRLAVAVLFAGIAVQVVYLGLLELAGVDTEGATPSTFVEEEGVVLVLLSVLALLVAPLAEELFFRGFVFRGLAGRFGFWWGAVASALLFALVHIEPIKLFPLFALGVLLAWVYHRTGSLWSSVLTHLFNNAIALTVVLV